MPVRSTKLDLGPYSDIEITFRFLGDDDAAPSSNRKRALDSREEFHFAAIKLSNRQPQRTLSYTENLPLCRSVSSVAKALKFSAAQRPAFGDVVVAHRHCEQHQ